MGRIGSAQFGSDPICCLLCELWACQNQKKLFHAWSGTSPSIWHAVWTLLFFIFFSLQQLKMQKKEKKNMKHKISPQEARNRPKSGTNMEISGPILHNTSLTCSDSTRLAIARAEFVNSSLTHAHVYFGPLIPFRLFLFAQFSFFHFCKSLWYV